MMFKHVTERNELWWLAAGPAIWFAHFMLSYATAAVLCAKVDAPIASVRAATAIYTLLALTAIAFVAWHGVRWRLSNARRPRDENTAEGRRHFLGFTTLLLCGLSFVAVLYVALVPVFIGDCR